MKENTLLEAALKYAKYGWHVFPCHSIKSGKCTCKNQNCDNPGKHPRTLHGLHDASCDESQIIDWWGKWPNANIGVKAGIDSKMWVLDADLPEGPGEVERMNLPETLKQQTGSGGFQYFFHWNGTDIRNSTKKVAPGVDVRGQGGYVIVPPSNHISGGNYKWLNKNKIVDAPEWLKEKVKHIEAAPPKPTINPDITPYAQKALAGEITNVSCACEGTRNEQLYSSTRCLAQLAAGGEISESTVRTAMLATATLTGLGEREARNTIDSAFKKGFEKPRSSDKKDNSDNSDNSDTEDNIGHIRTPFGQNRTNSDNSDTQNGRFQGNLKSELRSYFLENQGVTITTQEIDREFGLVHRQDKKNRSHAVKCLEKENIIISDGRAAGKYLILKKDIEWIDLENVDDSHFDIDLPLDLNQMVNLPPKCIVVLAGSSNAGKTAVAMEILKLNLNKPYGKLYLMSEMGPSEYVQRVKKLNGGVVGDWNKKIQAASVSAGFNGPVQAHNPDGLSVIDFLEEKDGEYYKITSDIRTIYDALGEGIAIVALQKHSKANVGRGGEGTTEKARLYLTIDTLAHQPQCTISAIKIVKAKDYPGQNPNGKEIHVKISASCEMEPISKWMYCNSTQREMYAKKYEGQMLRNKELSAEQHPDDVCAKFMCDDGDYHFVLDRDWEKWKKQFSALDLEKEIAGIEKWSIKNPLKARSWIFQVSTMLHNKNEEKKGKK
jgi:hypothetical protein